jgi:Tautomerase enzyme
MPMLKFDLVEGRTDEQIQTMLDAAHRAVLTAFNVPERDRYQVVNEHKASRMVIEDTGLGITRTNNVVVVSVVSRERSKQAKQLF